MSNKNRVLIMDIETAPMTAYIWNLKEQYIDLRQLKTDWFVLAWSAKWLGDKPSSIIYMDQRKARNVEDDKALLLPLWKLLNEADVVITQNGKRFDGPKLNARFILHGLPPPKPYKHLDTYVIVKRVAEFTSNKLEYLTDKLCTKYKKLTHSEFPGLSLWKECLNGNIKAWNEMKRYNIHDVLSTEEFYLKIRAWAPNNMPKVYEGANNQCATCGNNSLQKRGWHTTKTNKYQRYQCQKCGTWSIGNRYKETK